ncbi:hypothetical protein [Longitalea arenae]|uniref:hypothetical protein n=1 Tax=Longitalea arenae TaxID=2812558 RepID=UPI001967A5EA|nr:hypothetical protein [Longitalea arenae]
MTHYNAQVIPLPPKILQSSKGKTITPEVFEAILIVNAKKYDAMAYAFIVYDFNNPSIRKVLNDKHYLQDLDQLTGKYISLFYINSQEKKYKNNLRYPILSPFVKANELLRQQFCIDANLETPFVIFFQVDDDKIIEHFIIKLKGEKIEESYFEFRNNLRDAVKSLKHVTKENLQNRKEIFELLVTELRSAKFYKFIGKKIIAKMGVGTLISFVKAFF